MGVWRVLCALEFCALILVERPQSSAQCAPCTHTHTSHAAIGIQHQKRTNFCMHFKSTFRNEIRVVFATNMNMKWARLTRQSTLHTTSTKHTFNKRSNSMTMQIKFYENSWNICHTLIKIAPRTVRPTAAKSSSCISFLFTYYISHLDQITAVILFFLAASHFQFSRQR